MVRGLTNTACKTLVCLPPPPPTLFREDQIISDSPEKDSNASATTSEADGGGGAAEVLEAGAGGGATVGYLEAAKNNPENDPGTSLDNDLESDRGVDGDTVEQVREK